MVFNKIHFFLTFSKVELALAYGCSDSVSHETMLQYVHFNRHHNSMRINATGIFIFQASVWFGKIKVTKSFAYFQEK